MQRRNGETQLFIHPREAPFDCSKELRSSRRIPGVFASLQCNSLNSCNLNRISSVCLLCVLRVSAVRLHFPAINFSAPYPCSSVSSVKSVVKIFAVFAFCRGNFRFLVAAPLLCVFALKLSLQ